ncbi:hypothetical protein PIIN_09312 [Serendipita indica DSM 11827]|uniref:Uncharacterized protein n=1 Tax=Serendipita indica (strain DSM 11827) TaxID=1109443 RepID=G4TVI4_SERID|nr:hypothetical protein PIIN_09312 [Serendipita indica DSM 11827]
MEVRVEVARAANERLRQPTSTQARCRQHGRSVAPKRLKICRPTHRALGDALQAATPAHACLAWKAPPLKSKPRMCRDRQENNRGLNGNVDQARMTTRKAANYGRPNKAIHVVGGVQSGRQAREGLDIGQGWVGYKPNQAVKPAVLMRDYVERIYTQRLFRRHFIHAHLSCLAGGSATSSFVNEPVEVVY